MKVLITGTAGFIGAAVAEQLLARGDEVIGVDNVNDYYDVQLKQDRLTRLLQYDKFTDVRLSLEDAPALEQLFKREQPQRAINLAAQAGVRYSLQNPGAYIQSNVSGFMNILENCRLDWNIWCTHQAVRCMALIPACRFQYTTTSIIRLACMRQPKKLTS